MFKTKIILFNLYKIILNLNLNKMFNKQIIIYQLIYKHLIKMYFYKL